jgi:hypothetical protein
VEDDIVEDNIIEEGAMNLQATVVFNEAQLPKLVHEETHPARRPDHFGLGFLRSSGGASFPGAIGRLGPDLSGVSAGTSTWTS